MSATSFHVSVKPEFFVWARVTSGLTAEQLAKAAGVKLATWENWEVGSARPTFRQLESLARKCRRPVALFYLPEPPADEAAPADFRLISGAKAGEFAPDTLLAFRRARRLQSVAVESLDLGQPGIDQRLPRFDPGDDRERAGAAIRALMGITVDAQVSWADEAEAYRRWRLAAEALGLLVFQFRMPLEDARGFSLWDPRLPVVVVNSGDSPGARCFTLFHELAHLTLRTPGVCLAEPPIGGAGDGQRARVERFCDAVAAAVLLPLGDAAVTDALRSATARTLPEGIASAAASFKVSREAVLWMMVDARLVSRQAALTVIAHWTEMRLTGAPREKRKGSPSPSVRRLAERGVTFSVAVLDALDEGRITTPDASECLDLPPRQFDRLRERLRGEPVTRALDE